jgi:hypothetical protein
MQLTIDADHAPVPLSMQQRVQAAVLLQFVQAGVACRPTMLAICPGMDRRDLEVALAYLIEDGSIDGPPRVTLESLVDLAEGGGLTLTAHGRRRQCKGAADLGKTTAAPPTVMPGEAGATSSFRPPLRS